MPTLDLSREGAAEEERVLEDAGAVESFDRLAFAALAADLVRPPGMAVVVGPARSRLRVESGRAWGKGPRASWAMVLVPATASRKSIALAVSQLVAREAGAPDLEPYALDVLMARAAEPTP